jgi:hypothetical protein
MMLRTLPTEREEQLAETARKALLRSARIAAAVTRLQPLYDRFNAELCEQRLDALRHGEHMRVDALDRESDALVRTFREIAQREGEQP